MVGSFVILAILAIIRVWLEVDLVDRFGFLSRYVQYINWALIVAAGIFVLFTIITLFAKLFKSK